MRWFLETCAAASHGIRHCLLSYSQGRFCANQTQAANRPLARRLFFPLAVVAFESVSYHFGAIFLGRDASSHSSIDVEPVMKGVKEARL